MKANNPKRWPFYKYILIDTLFAAVLSFILINFVISAYKIESASMEPLLHENERIVISKINLSKLERFDIVVLYQPDEPNKALIKRIIGKPEEIIEIHGGDVYINDKPLKQAFLYDGAASGYIGEMKALLIPKGYYFVMGDNRSVSRDSRAFGPVPQRYIFGKAVFRYWPTHKFGVIQ